MSHNNFPVAEIETSENPDGGRFTTNLFPSQEEIREKIFFLTEENKEIMRARYKLVCSFTNKNFVDTQDSSFILGYPIYIDMTRRLITLEPELISYDQVYYDAKTHKPELILYNQVYYNVQTHRADKLILKTYTDKKYNYWLPIYINDKHFERGEQDILYAISKVYYCFRKNPIDDFKPEMVLKVLPSLMSKIVLVISKDKSNTSINAIYAYCHYLRLFMKFLDEYPELMDTMEIEIENFVKDRKFRHKNKIPDIGEFIIKLSLCKKYSYDDQNIQDYLLEEYFARQVKWIKNTYNRVVKGNFVKRRLSQSFDENIQDFLLEEYFERSVSWNKKSDMNIIRDNFIKQRLSQNFKEVETSNKLLVYHLMMVENFIYDGVNEKLDQAYGLPEVDKLEKVPILIKRIKNIKNYKDLMLAISYSHIIDSKQKMFDYLVQAINNSALQGYY